MKVAINIRHGGFGLSAAAVKRYAELKGKIAYFFSANEDEKFAPITIEQAGQDSWFTVFDVPNPKEIDENELWNKHYIGRDYNRTDKDLIQVIEEFGSKVNTDMSEIKVVEVPDDVKWHIDEYDGVEWIAEDHRCWDQDGEYGQI